MPICPKKIGSCGGGPIRDKIRGASLKEAVVRSESVVWKAGLIILALTLLTTGNLQAQTSMNITAGSFIESAGSFGAEDSVFFEFAATEGGANYQFFGNGGDHSGFQSCTSGCTLAEIVQDGKSVPLYLAANGSLTPPPGGGIFYCWGGSAEFDYSSGFSYHINSGVLTAQGNVTPNSISYFQPGDPVTCVPNALPKFVLTGQWHYVAQFARQNSVWYLTQLQIHMVP